jgi:hypothetical protein
MNKVIIITQQQQYNLDALYTLIELDGTHIYIITNMLDLSLLAFNMPVSVVVITEKGFDSEDNHVLGNEDYSSLVRT